MREHGTLQLLQRLTRADTELVGERLINPPVGGQRIRLATTTIQSQHKLGMQTLAQRMVSHQPLQFRGQHGVPAQSQVRIDPCFQRSEPQLTEAGRLNPGELVISYIGKNLTPP